MAASQLDLPDSPPLPPLPSTNSSPSLSRSPTIKAYTAQQSGTIARSKPLPSPAALAGVESAVAGPSSEGVLADGAKGEASSAASDALLDASLIPNPPLPSHLAPFLSPTSPLSPTDKRQLFTSVFLRSASAGNADTLEWLLSLPVNPSLSTAENAAAQRRFSLTAATLNNLDTLGDAREEGQTAELDLPDEAPRKWVDLEAQDEEGNPALVLCVAFGHAECVRVLVEGGVRVNQVDRAGWTPLHWAVQSNDIPIASYLLNHRASPLLASRKGLTARDLVKIGSEGFAMREVLTSAWEAALERERAAQRAEEGVGCKGKGKEADESAGMARSESRLSLAASEALSLSWEEREREKAEEQEREKEGRRRMQLAMESAQNLELDLAMLSLEDGRRIENEADSDSEEGAGSPFDWQRCQLDQMLVFSLADLPVILDVVITTIKPVRTRKYRVIPANVLFLCARFAHHHGNAELFDELLFGALERIEAAVHDRPHDMSVCAFWLSNCLLFLYYLRKEPSIAAASSEYQTHFADLINEIFVFIIRDAERRIDRVLEPALLDHEALPGFEDVAFEDEWASTRFVKKLTGRGKKGGIRNSTSARSIFSDAGSVSSVGGSSVGDPSSPPRNRLVSASQVAPSDAAPNDITALLTATLFVLQAYEIPPSIIVQAFSQLFYWIACEVFNRLLTQRKYLCRSRAMQIRLNASTLEDWARANRLPTKMVAIHFLPLNQLLQWLQCLSSESSIDGLISTVQSLRALNPLQLRKAVRDYRYEVDERKMDEDCVEYLVQIQKQWERNRAQKEAAAVAAQEQASDAAHGAAPLEEEAAPSTPDDVGRMIDDAFRDPDSFGSYTPPGGTETLSELLNSRYMLPFAVPTSADMLIHFDQPDAFGPFAGSRRPLSRSRSSSGATTPRSRLSLSSVSRMSSSASVVNGLSTPQTETSSLAATSRREPFAPTLPDDFFAVLDAAKAKIGRGQLVPSASAALLASVKGFSTPDLTLADGKEWWGGANGASHDTDEEEDEATDEAEQSFDSNASVVEYGGDARSRGGSVDPESSFESTGAEETPRMPSGFQH
ncbi:hypothetical protein NBRC10512_003485 [Rhodotorula toruloides]|uniref:RHTO0S02e15170g1_1 n=2 Tax=Rhodotorula toruloides TaxID=5286 RepID=A0A061AQ70_RHOTO|nr:DIL and Ankyrin domain containing protein [Rhodotorula toruloides NP11]EMS23375.1 DIL and Ankyrin domain containing protein [Rhodotorula toruloides NP11]CDR37462.1 RHTO0S02e15170g1_1 [Rhodotorula toruloides]